MTSRLRTPGGASSFMGLGVLAVETVSAMKRPAKAILAAVFHFSGYDPEIGRPSPN
jgi:hypothetical protein